MYRILTHVESDWKVINGQIDKLQLHTVKQVVGAHLSAYWKLPIENMVRLCVTHSKVMCCDVSPRNSKEEGGLLEIEEIVTQLYSIRDRNKATNISHKFQSFQVSTWDKLQNVEATPIRMKFLPVPNCTPITSILTTCWTSTVAIL